MQSIVRGLACVALLMAQVASACPPVAAPTAATAVFASGAALVCPATPTPQLALAAPIVLAPVQFHAVAAPAAAPRMAVRRRDRAPRLRRSRTLSVTRTFSR